MAKYMYGWDSVNHKKVYRGKYPDANLRGQGYFGRNEAGNLQGFVPKDYGQAVGFVGSDTAEYTFFDPQHGTHTFTASSYEDALRMAESMGYTESDYESRRRKRGKR